MLDDIKIQLSVLKNDQALVKSESELLRSESTQLKSELSKLSAQVQKPTVAAIPEEVKQQIVAIKSEMSKLAVQMKAAMTDSHDTLKSQITQLKSEFVLTLQNTPSQPVTQVSSSDEESKAAITQLKSGMVKLQQQTKTAMMEIHTRIETEEKERQKTDQLVADLKKALGEEKEARLKCEYQNQLLSKELQTLKDKGSTNPKEVAELKHQFGELTAYVSKLAIWLQDESTSRKQLEATVTNIYQHLSINQ